MGKVLSLFTGAGGLDLGFEAAGFDILAAVDTMPESSETLRRNRPNIKVYGPPEHSGDVTDINLELIQRDLNLKPGELDVIVGGPPCQPFSVAAAQRFLKTDVKFKRRGFDSHKGSLVFQYVRIVTELKPKVFMIENVPGFANIDKGKTVEDIKEFLAEYGYKVYGPFIVEAADYGVPQYRKRMILVGTSLDTPFEMPPVEYGPAHYAGIKNYHTSAQALWGMDGNLPNHETREHKKETSDRYKKISPGKREVLGRVDRLDPNRPSKTIIAGGSNGGGRSHLHPFIARTMSVRECARLQTFPDNYVFYGKNGRQFTQVGNAVPVVLAEQVAREIGRRYFGYSYTGPLKMLPKYPSQSKALRDLREWALMNARNNCYYDVSFAEDAMIMGSEFHVQATMTV